MSSVTSPSYPLGSSSWGKGIKKHDTVVFFVPFWCFWILVPDMNQTLKSLSCITTGICSPSCTPATTPHIADHNAVWFQSSRSVSHGNINNATCPCVLDDLYHTQKVSGFWMVRSSGPVGTPLPLLLLLRCGCGLAVVRFQRFKYTDNVVPYLI